MQINTFNISTKKIITIVAPFVVIMIGGLVYVSLQFHISSTNPSLSSVAQVSPFIIVNFNKQLSTMGLSVESNDNIISGYSVKGQQLTIQFNNVLDAKPYTIVIDSIQDTKGDQIKHKSLVFTPKDISSDKLPEDQKQALLQRQTQYLESHYDPILSHLPHGNLDFNLTATSIVKSGKAVVTLHAQLLLTEADLRIDPQAASDTYKQEVIAYIKSLGLDPTNYIIEYTINH